MLDVVCRIFSLFRAGRGSGIGFGVVSLSGAALRAGRYCLQPLFRPGRVVWYASLMVLLLGSSVDAQVTVVWPDPEVYRAVYGTSGERWGYQAGTIVRNVTAKAVQQASVGGVVRTADRWVSLAIGPAKYKVIGRVAIEAGLLVGLSYFGDWMAERAYRWQPDPAPGVLQKNATGWVLAEGVPAPDLSSQACPAGLSLYQTSAQEIDGCIAAAAGRAPAS